MLPAECWGEFLKVFRTHLVVEVGWIAALDARHLGLGQDGFDAYYGCGFVGGVGGRVADQLKHFCNMRDVGFAQFNGFGVVLGVVVAIGEAEPALIDFGDYLGRVLEVLVGAEGEEGSATVERGRILRGGEVLREVLLGFQARDTVEFGVEAA